MSESVEKKGIPEGYRKVRIGPDEILIPDEWSVETIGPYISVDTGSAFSSSNFNKDGDGIPLIRIRNLPDGETSTYYDGEFNDKYLAEPGSILVGMDGNFHTVRWSGKKGLLNQRVARIEADDSQLDEQFLYYRLIDEIKKIEERAPATTVKHLSQRDINDIRTQLPPLPEQRRIAGILSTVDKQIQQTDEIIEDTKELKRGLMQDLLHNGIGHERFKDMYIGPKRSTIPTEWDVVQLGDIADVQSGSTPKRSNEEYWDNGSIPWIKSGEFNDRVIEQAEEKITKKALDESGCIVFPEGTLLLALYGKGTVSKTARLGLDAATNQAIAGLLPKDGAFDPSYLQYYLIDSRNTLLNVTVNPSSDAARTNIYLSALRQFKIALPPLEEQRKIANRISTIDDKIEEEQEHKQTLNDLKRGLMQDLLTGKVRVKTDN